MTYFILDTNILIRDPGILTRWSPNYKLVIPRFIFYELDKVSSRLGGLTGQLWQNLKEAEYKNFIIVDNSDIPVPERNIDDLLERKLSLVDLQLVLLTQEYKNQKKEVILVSNDTAVRLYSEAKGLKTFDLFQFLNYINPFKTTLIEELKENESIHIYQRRKLLQGIVLGVILSGASTLIVNNFGPIYQTLNIWGTFILLLGFGSGFFWFRTNFRLIYGILEFLFGFYISTRVFGVKGFNYLSIEIVDIIQIVSGVYVMVRGLSNIDDGIKGTIAEPTWNKITRLKKVSA
ncbi:MAG TPA: PIN domain-containing protein [Saprospiraceae bacterium]|nr:PIN domain-containing protein [Saprospiraceae bacterium]